MSVNPVALHKWQYADYQDYHGSATNLWLHAFAVPLFLIGNLATVILPILTAFTVRTLRSVNGEDGLGSGLWLVFLMLLPGLLLSAVGMALQGRGHKMESNAPKPFTSAGNAIARIYVEQWVTFPRFVLSGGWLRALRASRSNST